MDEKIQVTASDRVRDIAVVGAGPAGLTAALALTYIGADVVLIGLAPAPTNPQHTDTRTAALLTSSVDLLKTLKVWEALALNAAPLKAIRIIDDSLSLLRSPEIEFRASELGLAAFGYNIPNSALTEALYARATSVLCGVEPYSVTHIELNARGAVLQVGEERRIASQLVVGADGRRSICRKAAQIGTTEWRYEQSAIATSFAHALRHENVSIELHRKVGSLTMVPLYDPCASSLIWVGETAEIGQLMRLDVPAFQGALELRLGGLLGTISAVGPRAHFTVAGLTAKHLAANRTALVGEAAHILPPIGAQGLNLGLRDAAALADCVRTALRHGGDPGGNEVLSAYDSARRIDVLTRTLGIDLLNRSLLSGFLPLQAVRGIISYGLNALPPLRRLVMRIGMAPPTKLPSLMRPAGS